MARNDAIHDHALTCEDAVNDCFTCMPWMYAICKRTYRAQATWMCLASVRLQLYVINGNAFLLQDCKGAPGIHPACLRLVCRSDNGWSCVDRDTWQHHALWQSLIPGDCVSQILLQTLEPSQGWMPTQGLSVMSK